MKTGDEHSKRLRERHEREEVDARALNGLQGRAGYARAHIFPLPQPPQAPCKDVPALRPGSAEASSPRPTRTHAEPP